MASRDKVDVDTFYKSIQYALEKLGKSKSGFERTAVSNFKSKKHGGSGNVLVDYSRAPCFGTDQWHVGSGNEIEESLARFLVDFINLISRLRGPVNYFSKCR